MQKFFFGFFTPIPCTSLPLDGMAKNYLIFYMDTQEHAIYHVWFHFIPTSLYPRREKNIWSELESYPDPLASQATTLTTRPWLLRQTIKIIYFVKILLFFSTGQMKVYNKFALSKKDISLERLSSDFNPSLVTS